MLVYSAHSTAPVATPVTTPVVLAAGSTVGGWVDSFTQWLVSAPVFFQMSFLTLVIIPMMVVGAWFLMFVVDRVGGAIELRAQRTPKASRAARPIKDHRGRGVKIVHHVTPES